MGNEKFVNYYIEGLISTLNDCLIRNISLQATDRISKEIIESHSKKIESLNGSIDALQVDLENSKKQQSDSDNQRYQNLENSIKDHLNTIAKLNGEVSQLNTMKNEYENVKHQVQHVDTFRTELNKTREELNNVRNEYEKKIIDLNSSYELQIKELNEKIDYLQLTPARRKKIEEVKKETTDTPTIDVFSSSEEILKDGGSF
jgi:DNA repair exonuclease SbcCD ATPase subunit